jgi:hypothetical protein
VNSPKPLKVDTISTIGLKNPACSSYPLVTGKFAAKVSEVMSEVAGAFATGVIDKVSESFGDKTRSTAPIPQDLNMTTSEASKYPVMTSPEKK